MHYDYLRQKNLNPPRAPDTCCWVFDNPTFTSWLSDDSAEHPLLWISADPGTGKSVLARAAVDDNIVTVTPCYFFFKDNDEKNKSALFALRSVLHQAFSHDPALIQHARRHFDASGPAFADSLDTLWTIFAAVALDDRAHGFCYIFDALDECDKTQRKWIITQFSLSDANPVLTPMEPSIHLSQAA